MNRLSLGIIALLSCLPSYAVASANYSKEGLWRASDAFESALNFRDFKRISSQTNRKLVEILGGEAALIEILRKKLDNLSFSNFRFHVKERSCAAVSPSIVCILPYSAKFVFEGETYIVDSFYLASTSDGGKSWYFADGNGVYRPGAMDFLFPEYKAKLQLPGKSEPRKQEDGGKPIPNTAYTDSPQ